jgi:hypothetical protein
MACDLGRQLPVGGEEEVVSKSFLAWIFSAFVFIHLSTILYVDVPVIYL